jgi:hypothetical protein
MDDNSTFKRVKSIVFGKHDEDFFNELYIAGYFDKNWNNKIKDLIKADFYGSREKTMTFTQEQENAIVDIIKRHITDIRPSSDKQAIDDVVSDKEVIDKSKEAIQALNNLQKFRRK